MSSPIRFNVAAAQDALARSDEGADPQPGDAELIAAYEGFCQQEWDRFQERQYAAERAAWLTTRCGGCEPGGTGEACDDHHEEDE